MEKNKFDDFCGNISKKWQKLISNIYEWFCGLENTLTEKNSINVIIIAVVCFVSIILMYYLNSHTPFSIDDYYYNFVYTTEHGTTFDISDKRISSFADIIISMKAHYLKMNGRILQHSIVQFFMMVGKPVFNVCNSIVFTATLFLAYKHCIGKSKRQNSAVLFLALGMAWWCFIPLWGQVNVWLDGSVNYLWGTTIRLCALLPFRLYADDGIESKSKIKIPLMFILCFLAGSTNENTAGAMIGMFVLFMIYFRVKKFKVPLWTYTGTVGAIIGFIIMITAPGNFNRAETTKNATYSVPFSSRLLHIPVSVIMLLSVFLAAILIFSLILYKYGKEKKNYRISISIIYLLGSFAGSFVMTFSPSVPKRAFFGALIASTIAVGNLVYQLKIAPAIFRRIAIIGVAFWSAWGLISYLHTADDAKYVMDEYVARVDFIEKQKEKGNYDVTVYKYKASDPHSPLYELVDIYEDPTSWPNEGVAKYFGLNSISGIEKIRPSVHENTFESQDELQKWAESRRK